MGCSTHYKLPANMPRFSQSTFEVKEKNTKNILLVSQTNATYHFLYQNTLGIPLANKSLKNGVFKSNAFLKPKKNIDIFFIKVLDFIKSQRKKDKIILKSGEMYEIRQINLS